VSSHRCRVAFSLQRPSSVAIAASFYCLPDEEPVPSECIQDAACEAVWRCRSGKVASYPFRTHLRSPTLARRYPSFCHPSLCKATAMVQDCMKLMDAPSLVQMMALVPDSQAPSAMATAVGMPAGGEIMTHAQVLSKAQNVPCQCLATVCSLQSRSADSSQECPAADCMYLLLQSHGSSARRACLDEM
jgi:hypothetical protein